MLAIIARSLRETTDTDLTGEAAPGNTNAGGG
jgi:hypothetical protein